MDGFGAVTIHEINVKNASDILAYGSKDQIMHLVKLYNDIAQKSGVTPLSMSDIQQVMTSRGLKGYGDIDWSAIGSVASQIGSGLASAVQAVGPLVLQKYQIDKLPSATPATTPAVQAAAAPIAGKGAKGTTDWTTYAMYGGGALLVGGILYFVLGKKKTA